MFDRKNNVVEVITERDSDRKTVQDMARNIAVRDQVLNIDRKQKLNLSLVELDGHVDRKPPTGRVVDILDILDDMIIVRDTQAETQTFAKLKPRTVIRANQAQDDCWEEGSRKMKQEEAGGEEEEEGGGGRGKEERTFAKLEPRAINSQKKSTKFVASNIENIRGDLSVNSEPNNATKNYSCNMSLQGESPLRGGGGRILKSQKRGTPSKLSLKNKIKLFETRASVGSRNGLVGLLLQSVGINPDNPTAGGGGGGTGQNSEICVNQPEGGTRTRPRARDFLGVKDWARIGGEMRA